MDLHLAAIRPKNLAFDVKTIGPVERSIWKHNLIPTLPEESKSLEDILPSRERCFSFGNSLPVSLEKVTETIEAIGSLLIVTAAQNPGVSLESIYLYFYIPQMYSFVRLRLGEDSELLISAMNLDMDSDLRPALVMSMFVNPVWNSNDGTFTFHPNYDAFDAMLSDPAKMAFVEGFFQEDTLEEAWSILHGCE